MSKGTRNGQHFRNEPKCARQQRIRLAGQRLVYESQVHHRTYFPNLPHQEYNTIEPDDLYCYSLAFRGVEVALCYPRVSPQKRVGDGVR